MLNNTPPDYKSGIDIYLDASGEDAWDKNPERFYINGLMLVNPRIGWLNWMERHKNEFEGAIHFSSGTYGNDKKLVNKHLVCKELLKEMPWAYVFATIWHKEHALNHMKQEVCFRPEKYEMTRYQWHVVPVQIGNVFVPYVNECLGRESGYNPIREVVINNPKSGDKGMIEREIEKHLHRKPIFVGAGHPGIDALDGVLWGLKRVVEFNKHDAVPWGMDEPIPKQLLIFGASSDEDPKVLSSLNKIHEWKDSAT